MTAQELSVLAGAVYVIWICVGLLALWVKDLYRHLGDRGMINHN